MGVGQGVKPGDRFEESVEAVVLQFDGDVVLIADLELAAVVVATVEGRLERLRLSRGDPPLEEHESVVSLAFGLHLGVVPRVLVFKQSAVGFERAVVVESDGQQLSVQLLALAMLFLACVAEGIEVLLRHTHLFGINIDRGTDGRDGDEVCGRLCGGDGNGIEIRFPRFVVACGGAGEEGDFVTCVVEASEVGVAELAPNLHRSEILLRGLFGRPRFLHSGA